MNTAQFAPSVTTQPASQPVTAGQTATFTAAASGNPTPTVQWQVSTDSGITFINISGATGATLSFTATTAQNGDEYQAVFTNSVGTATTNAATLTVNTAQFAPSVTTQPASQPVTAGQTATFTAAASGNPTPTVQWQVSTDSGITFINISGATSATLSFTATTAQNGDEYQAVFTNSVGTATTNAATLTVNTAQFAPSVTTQPASQPVTAGQTATFTAAASGNPTPTVQWQVSTDSGITFINISGATSDHPQLHRHHRPERRRVPGGIHQQRRHSYYQCGDLDRHPVDLGHRECGVGLMGYGRDRGPPDRRGRPPAPAGGSEHRPPLARDQQAGHHPERRRSRSRRPTSRSPV